MILKKTRIVLLVLLLLALALAVMYFVKSSRSDGAGCTFDSFACQSNDDLAGALTMGLIFLVLLPVNIAVFIIAKVKSRTPNAKEKLRLTR